MILDPLSFVPLEVERRTAELSRAARPRTERRLRRVLPTGLLRRHVTNVGRVA